MHRYRFFFILQLVCSLALGARVELPWSPLPEKPPTPKDNPSTREKISLGKQLFFDPRISLDGTISCNSCHNVMGNGTDNKPTSAGVDAKHGGRSAPTVWNSAFHSVQFWDGRAASLEDQAKGPMTNPVEMAMKDHAMVMDRISRIPGYVAQFKKVFNGENSTTIENTAKAIAAYERTLITRNSPFDRYMRGNKKAISAQAEKGMKTVIELGCITCHRGQNFNGTDLKMGEGFYQKFPLLPDEVYTPKYRFMDDKGRAETTKKEEDEHFWRVPTWRNVALTAPYFHNGSVATLEEAVRIMAKVQLGKEVTEEQVSDIVSFLNTLVGEFPEQTLPRLPETPGKTFFPLNAGNI